MRIDKIESSGRVDKRFQNLPIFEAKFVNFPIFEIYENF